ncbi:MAG: CDP-alcohol phosphatidyltransferase family protein [Neisseriaceae bacterium]
MNIPKAKALAWAVHLFTASGVVFGGLALLAILNDQPGECVLWLAVSLLIDGIDGTLARKFDVKNTLPQVDGSALDLIVDYLNYVFIPALFIYYYVRLPAYLALVTLAAILMTSLYCFSNVQMKSRDNYFVGFPATWNIVALYGYVLDLKPWANEIIFFLLCLLTFSTSKFLHPFRVRRLMPLNILMTGIWFATSLILAEYARERSIETIIWILWWGSSAYMLSISIWRTFFYRSRIL